MSKHVDAGPRHMPSWHAVRAHWAETDLWVRKDYIDADEFLEEKDACFACGFIWAGKLHRAHIKPRWKDGPDTPDNIHLLCRVCHKDSEGLEDEYYWDWFWQRSILDRIMSGAARGGLNVWSAMKELDMLKKPNTNTLPLSITQRHPALKPEKGPE